MELHKNWSVSENGLKKLKSLSKEDLKKAIAAKNLFAGLSTQYANAENAKIYGKINTSGAKKQTRSANTYKVKKGNGKDNKK